MNFADRSYPDIVRDLLTVLTGGTIQEVKQIGAIPPDLIPLEQAPVRRISHLAGTILVGRGAEQTRLPHRFTEKDFELVGTAANPVDKTALRLKKPERLAPNSTLTINYYPERLRPTPITDINVGSVARTLVETIARELATQYQQLQLVYDSAFVETATGAGLDRVAALVDVRRIARGAPVGKVRFLRAAGAAGSIFIPINSAVTDGKGSRYLTTVEATLQPGQGVAEVWVHGETPRTKILESGALAVLERAIAGIDRVVNDEPTWLATDDETDRQLSDRTRRAIHATGKGTLDAIRFGLESLDFVTAASLVEYPDPLVPVPGQLLVSVALGVDTPANRAIVDHRIAELRPAGIFIDRRFAGAVSLSVAVDLLFAGAALSDSEQAEAKKLLRSKLTEAIGAMAPGATLRFGPLLARLLADPRLADVKLGFSADTGPIADGWTIPADKAVRLADIVFASVGFETARTDSAPLSVMVDLAGRFQTLALSEAGARAKLSALLAEHLGRLAGGAAVEFTAIANALRDDASYVLDLASLVIVLEPQGGTFVELRQGDPAFMSPPTAVFSLRGVNVTGLVP